MPNMTPNRVSELSLASSSSPSTSSVSREQDPSTQHFDTRGAQAHSSASRDQAAHLPAARSSTVRQSRSPATADSESPASHPQDPSLRRAPLEDGYDFSRTVEPFLPWLDEDHLTPDPVVPEEGAAISPRSPASLSPESSSDDESDAVSVHSFTTLVPDEEDGEGLYSFTSSTVTLVPDEFDEAQGRLWNHYSTLNQSDDPQGSQQSRDCEPWEPIDAGEWHRLHGKFLYQVRAERRGWRQDNG